MNPFKALVNDHKVTMIRIERIISCFCPIGKQDYEANIVVNFEPSSFIPEYISMTEAIDNFNGKDLTIEDLGAKIYKLFQHSIMPKDLCVSVESEPELHAKVKVFIDECLED